MPLGDIGKNTNIDNSDKYVHFTFYFIFVLVWFSFFTNHYKSSFLKYYILLGAIGFGILMEICQGAFTTTRCPDVNDVYANSLGALFGIVIITLYKKNEPTV